MYFKRFDQVFLYIVVSVIISASCVCAEETSISYEITADLSWMSHDEQYHRYVINGADFPQITGRFQADSQRVHSSCSFFFTPVPEDESIPIVLRRFYAHPTALRFQLAVSPEHERTYIHKNPEKHFQSVTLEQQRSRSASADLQLYVSKDTALLFSGHSAKIEGETLSSNSLLMEARRERDEIQRSYSFGVSHYFLSYVQAAARYTLTGGEYANVTSRGDEPNPSSNHETTLDGDSEGKEIMLSGRYIRHNQIGIQGAYQYTHSTTTSTMVSWHEDVPPVYQNPVSRVSFDGDVRQHHVGGNLDFYWKPNVTFQLGGDFVGFRQETRYGTAQAVDEEWDRWTVRGGIMYYLHRHVGIWLQYAFSKQNGLVETWFPDSGTEQRTTYQTEADWQVVQIGVTGRL